MATSAIWKATIAPVADEFAQTLTSFSLRLVSDDHRDADQPTTPPVRPRHPTPLTLSSCLVPSIPSQSVGHLSGDDFAAPEPPGQKMRTFARPKHNIAAYKAVDAAMRTILRRIPIAAWSERLALNWGYRFRGAPRVVRLRSGPVILVDPTDYLQLMIYYFGTFEPNSLNMAVSCLSGGSTMIDVGANIGLYTLTCAEAVGPTGRVLSIEAAPPNARALRDNVRRNGMHNVTVIEAAAADTTGQKIITRPLGANLGMFTLGSLDGEEQFEVKLKKIDDIVLCEQIERVDLIKMDVEGFEYRALLGAEQTLDKLKPSVIIELNGTALRRCDTSPQQVKEFLYRHGYLGWIIGSGTLSPISRDQIDHVCDECLFLHRTIISSMISRGLPLARPSYG